MPAPVMPLRKCLIPLQQVKISKGKLHCTAGNGEETTCLFAVELSSFYLGPGVFALMIGSEGKPEGLPDALLPLTTQCLHLA